MANITGRVRANANQCGFIQLLMTEIAIGPGARWQVVCDVSFVLFGVEKSVEIVTIRKVALRRSGAQPLFYFVADGAGLLRQSRELRDVAFDAGFVTWKFKQFLFVSNGGRHQVFHQITLIVTRIAFQFVRLKRAGHFDDAQVRLMRELLVIGRCWR